MFNRFFVKSSQRDFHFPPLRRHQAEHGEEETHEREEATRRLEEAVAGALSVRMEELARARQEGRPLFLLTLVRSSMTTCDVFRTTVPTALHIRSMLESNALRSLQLFCESFSLRRH